MGAIASPALVAKLSEHQLSPHLGTNMAAFRSSGMMAAHYFSVADPTLSPAGRRQAELLTMTAAAKAGEPVLHARLGLCPNANPVKIGDGA